MAEDILLESGTNEAEFLEFFINGQSFGINVAKIMQIVTFSDDFLTKVPDGPDSLMGSFLWRDRSMELYDLEVALNKEKSENSSRKVVLITTFNNIVTAFCVDGVNRIHRVSWKQIKPVDEILALYNSRFTGTLLVDNKNVLLVDFEKIVFELNPDLEKLDGLDAINQEELKAKRGSKSIVFAEDSSFIRKNVSTFLGNAGYKILAFENGQAAINAIKRFKAEADKNGGSITDHFDLLLTDIEMPQMDGLTLSKEVRDGLGLSIPIVMFSSLIDDQMKMKCKEVGANDYIAKPRTPDLIKILDDQIFGSAR